MLKNTTELGPDVQNEEVISVGSRNINVNSSFDLDDVKM